MITKRLVSHLGLWLPSALLLSAACSGVANPTVLLPPGPDDAGATPSPTVDASSVDAAAPGASEGGGAPTTTPPTVTLDAAAGAVDATAADVGVQDTSAPRDQAAPSADAGRVDSGTTDSGSADDAGATFACGGNRCLLGSQTCCVQPPFTAVGMPTTMCTNAAACPAGDTPLRCSATTDCPANDLCCLVQAPMMVAECRPNCGGGQRILCSMQAGAGGCPTGQCTPNLGGALPRLPANVGICQ
jgi:hypothetical protein